MGIYELDKNYEKLFNEFDYALNSNEIILAQWRHENNTTFAGTWMQYLVPNISNDKLKEFANPKLIDSFEGWIGMFPSVDLVNEYEVIDVDGSAKNWDESSYYKDMISRMEDMYQRRYIGIEIIVFMPLLYKTLPDTLIVW